MINTDVANQYRESFPATEQAMTRRGRLSTPSIGPRLWPARTLFAPPSPSHNARDHTLQQRTTILIMQFTTVG